MIFNQDTNTENNVVYATVEQGEIREEFECSIQVCSNPVCSCRLVDLILHPINRTNGIDSEDPPTPYVVSIDLYNEVNGYKDQSSTSKKNWDFSNTLISNMDKSDFRFIYQWYYGHKNKITNETPDEEINAVFDFLEIEKNSILTAYQDILPFGDVLSIDFKGTTLVIIDQFCLLPRCTCSDIPLDLYAQTDSDESTEKSYSIVLDYQKKTWVWEGGEPPETRKELKHAIMEQIPDMFTQLKKRHERLKKIYHHAKKKHFSEFAGLPEDLPEGMPKTSTKKVGRNDLCPCGSGKKYKKCCLKKYVETSDHPIAD